MKKTTLSQNEIAIKRLRKLGLVDLTSYSKSAKKTFWSSVAKEYISQFDKLTAS